MRDVAERFACRCHLATILDPLAGCVHLHAGCEAVSSHGAAWQAACENSCTIFWASNPQTGCMPCRSHRSMHSKAMEQVRCCMVDGPLMPYVGMLYICLPMLTHADIDRGMPCCSLLLRLPLPSARSGPRTVLCWVVSAQHVKPQPAQGRAEARHALDSSSKQ